MPTYPYQVIGSDEIIEVEQSIKDDPLTEIVRDGLTLNVKRVISGGTGFILKGGMWARDGYEAGIQSPGKKG
jgi:predicted nucleic acid-binding Zn ribbon protein